MTDDEAMERDPTAIELKALLCDGCYRSLIAWIMGRSTIPYQPCATCAPKSESWLAKRGLVAQARKSK